MDEDALFVYEDLKRARRGQGLVGPGRMGELSTPTLHALGAADASHESLFRAFLSLKGAVEQLQSIDQELLRMALNLDGAFGVMNWTTRSYDYAESCDWCSNERTIRHHVDQALTRLARLIVAGSSESLDSPPAPLVAIEQVALLRWDSLTQSQKREYYDQLTARPGTTSEYDEFPAPAQVVNRLNTTAPIDLEPYFATVEAFHPDISVPDRKVSRILVNFMEGRRLALARRIDEAVVRGLTEMEQEALYSLYEYHSCAAAQAKPRDRSRLDVVIVPGARPRAARYRVDELYRLCTQADPVIVLIGHSPVDEVTSALVSEADAMYHYLTQIRGLDVTQRPIVRLRTATNTLEAVVSVLPTLNTLAAGKGRPLRVGLITAPYHMRRLSLTTARVLNSLAPHLVESLHLMTSSASIDLRALMSSEQMDGERRRYGISIYLLEYVKIVRARLCGSI